MQQAGEFSSRIKLKSLPSLIHYMQTVNYPDHAGCLNLSLFLFLSQYLQLSGLLSMQQYTLPKHSGLLSAVYVSVCVNQVQLNG